MTSAPSGEGLAKIRSMDGRLFDPFIKILTRGEGV